MKRTYQLRLLDSVRDHNILDLPCQYSGSQDDCKWYALEQGYQWRRDGNVMGGYYAHPATGNVLYLT